MYARACGMSQTKLAKKKVEQMVCERKLIDCANEAANQRPEMASMPQT
jgi:hypothetical protein